MATKIKPLGEFAQVFVGLPTRASDTIDTGRPGNLLTVRSLTGTSIDAAEFVTVDVKGKDVDRYRVRAGDVLMSARSTSLKTAIVPPELEGTVINATVLGIRCLPVLEPRILVAWLEGDVGRAALEASAQSGTSQMNLTLGAVAKITVPVPVVETQKQLAAILVAADEAYLAAIQAAEIRRRLAKDIIVDSLKTGRAL